MAKDECEKKNDETKERDDMVMDDLVGGSMRSVATSAGDLRSAVLREVDRILDDNRSHPVAACRNGLDRLVDECLISAEEAAQLAEICKLVFERQTRKMGVEDATREIDAIYHPMLVTRNASPVALAIGSMASAVEIPEGKSLSAAASGHGGDIGMVGGAIAGAAVGAAIGGWGGAVVGAVVGGIAGGVAGACLDD